MLAASLETHGVSESDPGVAFGKSVAAAIVALRATDNASAAQFDYTVPGAGAAGVWERLGNAAQSLLPGWGSVTPFVLRSGSQFRPDGPPALDSDTLRKGLQRDRCGRRRREHGAHRRADADCAVLACISNRDLESDSENGDPVTQPRSRRDSPDVRRSYLAASDASVACWDAKYVYNFWRPQPAIANADLDGNPATGADPPGARSCRHRRIRSFLRGTAPTAAPWRLS